MIASSLMRVPPALEPTNPSRWRASAGRYAFVVLFAFVGLAAGAGCEAQDPAEAAAMADAIEEFMETNSHRSLGVAVMNQSQMEFIEGEMERRRGDNPKVADYYEKMFVAKSIGVPSEVARTMINFEKDLFQYHCYKNYS